MSGEKKSGAETRQPEKKAEASVGYVVGKVAIVARGNVLDVGQPVTAADVGGEAALKRLVDSKRLVKG